MDELWSRAAESVFGGVVLALILSLIVLGKLRLEREVTDLKERHATETAELRKDRDFWRDIALDAAGVVIDSVDLAREAHQQRRIPRP